MVRNMTMTCARWTTIAFSSEYYQSGLKILVKKGDQTTSLAGSGRQEGLRPDRHAPH